VKFRGVRQRSRIQALLENLLPGLEGIDPAASPEEQLHAGAVADIATGAVRFLES
jgi:hypothetical protein